jgi:hypothetical protein
MISEELPNTPPKFDGIISPTMKIQLVKGEDGELEDDSTETYISPIARDTENDKIIMSFEGG